jgi:hypothetical protein
MGQHGQRLNTGTCFSVSSDVKLVLILFPGIPTGDPAIVTFYDKRIVPKWPLISRKETASEYDKINNCAMIRPPLFVTIEGQLPSVRTVINMLHFLNQLIVYTIKSHLSLPPSFINTMYVTTVKGGTRERCYRIIEAWTNGRTTVCHKKSVCWRAYKNEWPISWNYEYIIFGQIIFQNFHQFKACVG